MEIERQTQSDCLIHETDINRDKDSNKVRLENERQRGSEIIPDTVREHFHSCLGDAIRYYGCETKTPCYAGRVDDAPLLSLSLKEA